MILERGARRAAGNRIMALTCRNVQHLQDAYLDADLSASMIAEVDAHLLQCPECQRSMELMRACGNVVARDRSEPRLADDFAMRVLTALPKAASHSASQPMYILTRRQRRRLILERVAAGAIPAIAAAIVLFILILPASRPDVEVHRVLGASESRQPVDALGVRSLVDPTLATLSDTHRAAGNLGDLARLTLEQAREQLESAPPAAQTPPPESGALFMELLHPLMSVLQPPAGAEPAQSDEIVRF